MKRAAGVWKIAAMAWALVLAAEAHAAIIKPQAPSDSPAVSYRWPIVTAPVMAKAPTMDGAVGREEWAAAAQLAPMVTLEHGLATDETTAMFVGYTAEALYIAFKFGRPPYALEPKSSPEPLAVWGDDCIEFFLRPEFGAKWEYSFVGNAAGVHEEGRRKGNTDKGWKCDWRYAARRTDWGWEGEMAIPFASLGVATPKPGEVWEIAPVRNQKTPRQDLACWSYLKDWNACEDFGYLAFGGDAPAVRVLQAGEISRNEVGALVEVANFTAKDATLTVNMTLLKPKADDLEYFSVVDTAANPLGQQTDAKDSVDAKKVAETALQRFAVLKKAEQTLTVPARQTRRIPFTTESTRGNYILHYEVREAQSGAILSAGPLPFYRRAPLEVALTPYLLSAGVVEVAADYRKLLGVQQGDQVVVQVLDPGRTKVLREKREAVNLAARQTVIDVPASDLPPGGYAVRCLLNAADGQSKAEREQDFKLAPKPAWWDNKFGCPEATDSVPEPWTPMSPAGEPRPYGGEKTASGFEVWNRKVTLGEALQPSQIANGRVEMLARPVRLDIKAAGLAWGAVEVVKATKTGIAWRQTLRGENLSGELLLSAEFDGFMKYTLRLEPKAAATLERMVLVIPLKPEVVTHYQHGALGTPPSRTEVKVTKGYGVLPSEGLALPFTDSVWLGTDELGLQWVAETDQGWAPADAKKAVEVMGSALRVNFVNQPLALSQPVKYEWAIIPTPAKPMNHELLHQLRYAQSGWGLDASLTRLSDDTPAHIDALVDAGVNAYGQWAWQNETALWNPDFGAPGYRPTPLNEVRKKAFRQAIEMAHKKGIKWVTVYAIWNCFQDWPDVGDAWKEQARMPLVPGFGAYLYCSAKPFADWHVATLRKTIEEVGIDGVYLDSSPDPHLCANRRHGCGYVGKDGKMHGTYPVFAARELHKRIYTLFHGELKRGGLVYAHNSHFPFAAVESFVDVHHCGEGSTLSRDIAIPKFYGRPFGLPVSFTRWNNPIYPETRMNSWRFVLQVDSTIKAHPSMVISKRVLPDYKGLKREDYLAKGYDPKGEAVWPVWQAYRDFPWEGAQWLPSWRIEPYAQTGDPDLWACMHLNPGKAALITVSSFKDADSACKLQLDWKKLGFEPSTVTVTDRILLKELPAEPSGLTLDVKAKLWRMVEIRKKSVPYAP